MIIRPNRDRVLIFELLERICEVFNISSIYRLLNMVGVSVYVMSHSKSVFPINPEYVRALREALLEFIAKKEDSIASLKETILALESDTISQRASTVLSCIQQSGPIDFTGIILLTNITADSLPGVLEELLERGLIEYNNKLKEYYCASRIKCEC